MMDNNLTVKFGWPCRFEEIFPLAAAVYPYVAGAGQRVVAMALSRRLALGAL